MLGPALLQGPGGLSFEVDDDKVVFCKQHLPQMVVAMVAGFGSL